MARLLPLGLLAGALALTLATSGCSSSKNSNAAASSAPTTAGAVSPSAAGGASASPAASGAARTVTVTETEYALRLSQQSGFSPGTYTFEAQDAGQVSHALAIAGPGVATARTATIAPGGSAELTVTLQKGAYELWCPVDSHKSLGMDTHIQVS